MGRVDARLIELGIELPPPPRPIANFLPFILDAGLVYLAGQTNDVDGAPSLTGKVPTDHDSEAGWAAARICALNLVAVLREACEGDLDRVERCVTVRGFVNAEPGFGGVGLVINGASELLIALFGERGRHARTAVGVAALPRNALVEVDAVFRVASRC